MRVPPVQARQVMASGSQSHSSAIALRVVELPWHCGCLLALVVLMLVSSSSIMPSSLVLPVDGSGLVILSGGNDTVQVGDVSSPFMLRIEPPPPTADLTIMITRNITRYGDDGGTLNPASITFTGGSSESFLTDSFTYNAGPGISIILLKFNCTGVDCSSYSLPPPFQLTIIGQMTVSNLPDRGLMPGVTYTPIKLVLVPIPLLGVTHVVPIRASDMDGGGTFSPIGCMYTAYTWGGCQFQYTTPVTPRPEPVTLNFSHPFPTYPQWVRAFQILATLTCESGPTFLYAGLQSAQAWNCYPLNMDIPTELEIVWSSEGGVVGRMVAASKDRATNGALRLTNETNSTNPAQFYYVAPPGIMPSLTLSATLGGENGYMYAIPTPITLPVRGYVALENVPSSISIDASTPDPVVSVTGDEEPVRVIAFPTPTSTPGVEVSVALDFVRSATGVAAIEAGTLSPTTPFMFNTTINQSSPFVYAAPSLPCHVALSVHLTGAGADASNYLLLDNSTADVNGMLRSSVDVFVKGRAAWNMTNTNSSSMVRFQESDVVNSDEQAAATMYIPANTLSPQLTLSFNPAIVSASDSILHLSTSVPGVDLTTMIVGSGVTATSGGVSIALSAGQTKVNLQVQSGSAAMDITLNVTLAGPDVDSFGESLAPLHIIVQLPLSLLVDPPSLTSVGISSSATLRLKLGDGVNAGLPSSGSSLEFRIDDGGAGGRFSGLGYQNGTDGTFLLQYDDLMTDHGAATYASITYTTAPTPSVASFTLHVTTSNGWQLNGTDGWRFMLPSSSTLLPVRGSASVSGLPPSGSLLPLEESSWIEVTFIPTLASGLVVALADGGAEGTFAIQGGSASLPASTKSFNFSYTPNNNALNTMVQLSISFVSGVDANLYVAPAPIAIHIGAASTN